MIVLAAGWRPIDHDGQQVLTCGELARAVVSQLVGAGDAGDGGDRHDVAVVLLHHRRQERLEDLGRW